MQTMDSLTQTPHGALNSPAAQRNSADIVARLGAHLPKTARVLEIASGSGQHAVAAVSTLPGLDWQPSDPSAEARASIDTWARQAQASTIRSALDLDMLDQATWPSQAYDALVCINMVHISPWAATEGLMQLASQCLPLGAILYLYGPYREAETPLAPSNANFDQGLKSRNPDWGLRHVADIEALAREHGLRLTLRTPMRANNLSLIFRRV
jgi:cyclopropane fatty-acyl-phospholipid synthase-like methyltransferase